MLFSHLFLVSTIQHRSDLAVVEERNTEIVREAKPYLPQPASVEWSFLHLPASRLFLRFHFPHFLPNKFCMETLLFVAGTLGSYRVEIQNLLLESP